MVVTVILPTFRLADAFVNLTFIFNSVKVFLSFLITNKLTKKNDQKTNSSFNSSNIGAFGSVFDLSKIKIKDPVIVSCTDGVGTKIDLTNKFKKFDTIGIDLVAMCVNDLITLQAEPLFFLDYLVTDKINLNVSKEIIKGITKGCKDSQCSLIGGETAEHPNAFPKGKFDLAGFCVGVLEKSSKKLKNQVKKLVYQINNLALF